MPPIILVDCHNVAHAAFYALGQLDYHGRRTGVIYGFFLRVFSIAEKFGTRNFVFCWDSKQSLRRARFKDYKDRSKKPKQTKTYNEVLDLKALHKQIDEIRDIALPEAGFNNNILRSGYEADDVIAAVIRYGEFHNTWCQGDPPNFLIVSSDKDLYQLLGPNVAMYNLRSGSVYRESDFRKEYRIPPDGWPAAKALGGCVSDTLQGIDGIADPAKSKNSRAIKYLRGELTGKWLDEIESRAGREIYNRNFPLVSLPIKPFQPIITEDTYTKESFINIFDKYGFESFLRKDRLREILAAFNLK